MACPGLRWVFAVAVVLAGAAPASAAPTLDPADFADLDLRALPETAETTDVTPGDVQTLRQRIAEIVARTGAPGAAVAVVGPGGLVLADGFGEARDGVAMDAHALFRVGSITKSFISLAVMRLVELGKLRLEDRVMALAPELKVKNPFERTHPLKVAHLLEHTSGFDEMRFNEIFDRPAGADRPLREVLAVNPRSRVSRWEPGTRFSYSQPGYTTAAYLIEKISGMPYARFLEQEVFRPLGIQASVVLTDEARRHLAEGHVRGRPQPYLHLLHRPSMNLMISAHGMSRLLGMLLGRGKLDDVQFLSAAGVARIERSGTLPYGPPTVRYGLGNWGDVSGPVHTRGHGGFMPGYGSVYRYSVARGWGYAILINDANGWRTLGGISQVVLKFLLAGTRPTRPQPVPLADLGRFTGRFRLAAPEVEFLRFQTDVYGGIELVARDGTLFLTEERKDRVTPLVATGPDTFRLPREIDSSIQFIRDGAGRRAVILGQTYFEEENAWWAWARKWALELAVLLMVSTGWIPMFLFLRRRSLETALLLRPFLAAACLLGMSTAFDHARESGDLGLRTVTTLTVWVLSWAFALFSYSSMSRASQAGQEVAWFLRAYAVAVSGAAVWIALHLSRYGLIGLRTWRW
jgi:CubicO group peptidase (beta-lactamase class C family)